MHRVDHADEVDVDGVGEGLHRKALPQRTDARIGDDHIEPAEFGYLVREFARHGGPVPHVDLRGVRLLARLLHHESGLFEVPRRRQRVLVGLDVMADVEQDDGGTLLVQLHGVAAALAASTVRDQNYFSLYPA